jgi:hypothetical protein
LSPTDTLIDAAGRWFLHSGIQEASGGVARYYRSDLGQNARVSTEITGYAVSTFLFLHERTGDAAYLDAALRAARFLTRVAWDPKLGTFPFELPANTAQGSGLAYFFDCGIIVRGLLCAWRVTGETEFRDTAVAAGQAMLADFQAGQVIHPILALPDKRPLAWEPRWSASAGCYQLKSAMAWHGLFEATGVREFQCGYEAAVQAALEDNGTFLTAEWDPLRIMDRLHAYAYFLEGLLPVLDRAECAKAFRDGVERTAALLREIEPVFARSDVYAQLLRARLAGEACGVLPFDEASAAYEAEQAAGFQVASDDPRVSGGFLFGRKHGDALPFVNPVSTAFCVQALAWWGDKQESTQFDSKSGVI